MGLNSIKATSDFSIMLKSFGGLLEILTERGLVTKVISESSSKIIALRFFLIWQVGK